MASETALSFIRSILGGRKPKSATVLFGPHAFVREFALDALARSALAGGLKYRSIQVGASQDYSECISELNEADLFAPKRLIVCRVTRAARSSQTDAESDDDSTDERAGSARDGDEAAMAEAIGTMRGDNILAMVFDKETVPAKIRKAAEAHAVMVNCTRAFDNQIGDYAGVFAQSCEVTLAPAAVDSLIDRHGVDLAAIYNAIAKAAIVAADSATIEPDHLDDQGAIRMPGAFELADSLARGRTQTALAQLARSLMLGRDAIELLAVEIIPLMRRMMIAAALSTARKSSGDIAAAMGLYPNHPMAQRAIEGARRIGRARLERAYAQAAALDAGFKNGTIKERDESLARLVVEMMAPAA
jgi:DNA polymerase III delta subunit